MQHQSVCLEASITGLNIQPGGIYVDGTFGRGGHAGAILDRLDDDGRLYAYDWDPEAQEVAREKFESDHRFIFCDRSFSAIPQDMEREGLVGKIHGVLLDLGVSSPQLDDAQRGFSFMNDGPLDMRMDPRHGRPASAWLSEIAEHDLFVVIRRYGEERFARRIAKAICAAREEKVIATTSALAKIVVDAVPFYETGKHPATRTFQAIRIIVNEEFVQLEQLLDGLLDVLDVGGRIVVLSYHSLEHKIIKNFLKKYGPGHEEINHMAIAQTPKRVRLRRVGQPVKPDPQEVRFNRRSRSAFLRVLEKMA